MEAILFHRQRKNNVPHQAKSLKDLTRFMTPSQFFAEERRHSLLQKIKEFSALELSRYESLCHVLLENMVDFCQSLPETSHSYYSQPGGLVDHSLNRTEAALGLFKEFMILEQENTFSEEQKLWQYVLFSAAVLQGIGKLFVDYRVNLYDSSGHLLKKWNPLLESMIDTGTYYDYDFLKESEVDFRRRLNLLLARILMPVSGFTWISTNPQALAVWLALLNEDTRSAGTLGAILIRADAIAIQRYFNELLIRNSAARGGRYGRAGTFSVGGHSAISEKEQAIGAEFIQWLYNALDEGRIMVNKPPLFMVPGGLLMCQEMFQWFVREHPEYKNWQAIQKSFLSLGLHSCGVDGSVISRFELAKTKEMQSGIVFSSFAVALPASVKVQHLNAERVDTLSATELISRAQYPSHFTELLSVAPNTSLQKLSASGQWQLVESEGLSLKSGAKQGG